MVVTSRPPAGERRLHVRVRPTADYDVEVLVLDGIVAEKVGVVDIGVGGLGLLLDTVPKKFVESGRMRLRITLPGHSTFEVDALVRHVSPRWGVCGVQLDADQESATKALRTVVSELLERASF